MKREPYGANRLSSQLTKDPKNQNRARIMCLSI